MMPFSLLAATTVWQTPTLEQLVWLGAIGAMGSINNLCIAQAFKVAEVSAVMPLDFSKLIWASIIGYVFFAEVPVVWTWVGGSSYSARPTYIAYREAQVKEKKADGSPG